MRGGVAANDPISKSTSVQDGEMLCADCTKLADADAEPEPAGPTARAEARADRHERLGAGGRAGRVEGVDR